jgi:hypothetical protein
MLGMMIYESLLEDTSSFYTRNSEYDWLFNSHLRALSALLLGIDVVCHRSEMQTQAASRYTLILKKKLSP